MRSWAHLRRVRPLPDGAGTPEHFGDSYGWGAGIPTLYRALASPGGVEATLAPPDGQDSYADPSHALMHACAYWAALLHLLTFSFGWTQPGRGLLTWVAADPVEGDPRLALLDATYRRDQQLGALVEWLLHSPAAEQGVWRQLAARRGKPAPASDSDPKLLQLARRLPLPGSDVRSPRPEGGGDPLHPSTHLSDAFDETGIHDATVSTSNRRAREAVLICSSLSGWYAALCQHGDELQVGSDRSWRVEVFVRPVGLMGTFRRARATNIWFSGRHRHHLWGNPPSM